LLLRCLLLAALCAKTQACCGFNGEILGCFFPLLVPICYKCVEKVV